jgi:transposase-like protein
MGQVLHGSATATETVRRAIHHSQESLRALAKRYGINQKTVAKWRKREGVSDLPTGPKEPRSTVLTVEEEAIIVAFRRHTLLPLDDCLYSLQATIPHLSRSSLHLASGKTIPRIVFLPSSPATPRHLAPARRHRRRRPEEEVQKLSDRLLPHRHRRGADRRGQAPSYAASTPHWILACGLGRCDEAEGCR